MKKGTIQFLAPALIWSVSCAVFVGSTFDHLSVKADTQTTKADRFDSTSFIWPAQGKITQGFSYHHEGIDIAGPLLTPIFAAKAGKIVSAGWNDWGLGNAITIQHSDGTRTVYGHASTLLVALGQQVQQGEIIAQMGNTGNSAGPHLHFEIYLGRDQRQPPVNPISLLPPLVAGKIPPLRPVAPEEPVALNFDPPAPAAVASAPVVPGEVCRGTVVISGDTDNFHVKICREKGQLFYLGQSKQNPGAVVRLPARSAGKGRYRADNGNYSYYISPEQVEVWHNGRQFRSEHLYSKR